MRDSGIPVSNVVDPYPIRSEENVSTSLLLPAVTGTGTGKKRIGYPCRALTHSEQSSITKDEMDNGHIKNLGRCPELLCNQPVFGGAGYSVPNKYAGTENYVFFVRPNGSTKFPYSSSI
jgi:hypothetical protein